MANEELKAQIQALQKLLESSKVSAEDRNLLGNLMEDMVEIANAKSPVDESHQATLQERLERYAGEFEQRHPTTAGVMRQVADALGKMGV